MDENASAESPDRAETAESVGAAETADTVVPVESGKRPSTRDSGSDDKAIDQLYSRGRLVQMPSMRGRNQELRHKLLKHIAATSFEPGRVYTEAEVNALLMAVYDDYTALRRYLVEAGHIQRDRAGREYQLPEQAA
jgi:hypothetical protein